MAALVKAGKIRYEKTISHENNLKKLLAGRVDCIITEKASLVHIMAELQEDESISRTPDFKIGANMGLDKMFVGYSKKFLLDGDTAELLEIVRRIDAEIFHMRQSGELDQLIRRHLSSHKHENDG